jgi:hypothetical protein
MPRKPKPSSTHEDRAEFPFPIGTTQVARTLIRMHQFLRGELVKAANGETVFYSADACHEQMRHIEATLAFMQVNFVPAALKPRKARPKIGPLSYGEIRSGVLHALKQARQWQTYPEIADAILVRHRITLDGPARKHFLQKLREAVHFLKAQGAVVPEHDLKLGQTSTLQRWRLSSLFD